MAVTVLLALSLGRENGSNVIENLGQRTKTNNDRKIADTSSGESLSGVDAQQVVEQPTGSMKISFAKPDFGRIEKVANFRAFMHDAIARPDLEKVALAVRMMDICTVAEYQRVTGNPKFKVPNNLVNSWRQREAACAASGGIDSQQRTALRAVIKKDYPSLYAPYYQRIEANETQRLAIDGQSDPHFVVSWGFAASNENKSMLAGDDPNLRSLPETILAPAWHAAVCSLRDCDELDYRVQTCSSQGLCDDIPIARLIFETVQNDYQITQEKWRDIVTASQKRAETLFPRVLARAQ